MLLYTSRHTLCSVLAHNPEASSPMPTKLKVPVDDEAEEVVLPMDGFSVRARAAVELAQQSENALSFLDRKTGNSTDLQALRGTAWPRDEAKRGSICQIVVRDTGFRRGVILWRSVGLLVDGIGDNKGGERAIVELADTHLRPCGQGAVPADDWYEVFVVTIPCAERLAGPCGGAEK